MHMLASTWKFERFFMKNIFLFICALLLCTQLSAQNTVATDSILQLSTCAGGNVIVPFQATGNFPFGNIFTAQLSNAFGQFTNPINIGTVPFNLGFILATIPSTVNFGLFYKIRVISSNPGIIGSPCPNTLIITQVAQLNQVFATPNDTICQGETATLTALNPTGSYLWSTGETTQSISVAQSGNYSVTVTDLLQCESDKSIAITVLPQPCWLEISDLDAENFEVFPNPSFGKFQIQTDNFDGSNVSVAVFNALGQAIQIERNTLNHAIEINLLSADAGLYFVKITKDKRSTTQRIVKH